MPSYYRKRLEGRGLGIHHEGLDEAKEEIHGMVAAQPSCRRRCVERAEGAGDRRGGRRRPRAGRERGGQERGKSGIGRARPKSGRR